MNIQSPAKIYNREVQNRLVFQPMEGCDGTCDGAVDELTKRRYLRFAKSGAGIIWFEATAVCNEGRANPRQLFLNEKTKESFRNLLEEVRKVSLEKYGFSPLIIVQLTHSGRFSKPNGSPEPIVAYRNEHWEIGKENQPYIVADDEYLSGIPQKYAAAARLAEEVGFDGIDVKCCHGYLLQELLSAFTREGRYGGCFENRMRLPIEIAKAVRKAVGEDMPIEFRFSGSEVVKEGFGLDEGVKIAQAMDGYVDIIHVSAGTHEVPRSWPVVHPSMFSPDGVNSVFAREIKKHVKKSLVSTVGAFTDPQHMEDFLASGGADIINVARQSLADPDFPIKVRAGREDEIAKCIRCNKCFMNSGQKRTVRCSLNPEVGMELDAKMQPPVLEKRRVMVAGGGVGGMEAAIQCAKRGHDVVLCEKSGSLGGVLKCEAKVPFKKNLDHYLRRQIKLMEKYGVEIRLNTAVTPEYVDAQAPDVLIAALGAVAITPPIPGIEKALAAEKVYVEPELAQGKVVILGAGLVGLELGIWLAQTGREVEIVEMRDRAGIDLEDYPYLCYKFEIEDNNIRLSLNTKAVAVEDDGLVVEREGVQSRISADCVICAAGYRPLSDECDALNFTVPEFYPIGDCMKPDSIMSATKLAYSAAMNVGRV